jgi:hypothetical protein
MTKGSSMKPADPRILPINADAAICSRKCQPLVSLPTTRGDLLIKINPKKCRKHAFASQHANSL